MIETIDVAVIGAGQAGLATSSWLTRRGISHVVLERRAIAESWRRRWTSLRLVSPNFLNRLPGHPHGGGDPDGFLTRDETIAYLTEYAAAIEAPVREHVTVRKVRLNPDGFDLVTDAGAIRTRAVVVATGAHQRPHVPPAAAALPSHIHQLHADAYVAPDQLPSGPALVVGGGQAGCQIALELHASGRPVVLSAGRCTWYPRRLYGRDILWWRDRMGEFDVLTDELPDPAAARVACTPLIRAGAEDLNLRIVARAGVMLVGRFAGVESGRARFASDLHADLRWADDAARLFVARIHPYARAHGATDEPEPPPLAEGWDEASLPPLVTELDVGQFATVLWATGYRPDVGWIEAPIADASGAPMQHGGVSSVPGLYFMGLHLMIRRGSGFILGVGRDAEDVTAAVQRQLDGACDENSGRHNDPSGADDGG